MAGLAKFRVLWFVAESSWFPLTGGKLAVLAQLIPAQGGEPITIDRDVTVVGRQQEHCDLVLERKSVSKMHCIIAKTDGLLFVRDLSSTNGTKVNGQKIIRGALLPGDQLSFAGEKFKVQMGPSPQPPVALGPGVTEAIPASQFPGSSVGGGADLIGRTSAAPLLDEELPPGDEDLLE
ncbi:MAG: FHA domain-containing protein [Planctomycetales bacterium]